MKSNSSLWLILAIFAVLFISWEPLMQLFGVNPTSKQTEQTESTTPEQTTPTSEEQAVATAPEVITEAQAVSPDAAVVPADNSANTPLELASIPTEQLTNGKLTAEIDPNIGAIVRLTYSEHLRSDLKNPINLDDRELLKILNSPNFPVGMLGAMTPENYKLSKVTSANDGTTVTVTRTFRRKGASDLTFVSSWQLKNDYEIDFNLKISSPGNVILPELFVSGGTMPGWQVLAGDKLRRGDSQKLSYQLAGGDFDSVNADAKHAKFFPPSGFFVDFAGISNKYFCAILDSDKPFTLWQNRVEYLQNKNASHLTGIGAKYSSIILAPGVEMDFALRMYAGPKSISGIRSFHPDAQRMMHLAWGPLDYLSRFLLWFLNTLEKFLGSYGWSIIILTLLVRAVFWPITARSNESMKKMQTVQPKIQEIRAKYKDNPEMLNTKTMELYRTEKINPLGGCLPILLQIPVFFALYATLDGAVELRQTAFLWINDLAMPDTIFAIPLGFMNLDFNPLVLAMCGLMVLQQQITPSSMDPMQRKMMLLMPLVMLFFMYSMPSGLTLYWTVSSLCGILQMLWQQKRNNNPINHSGKSEKVGR